MVAPRKAAFAEESAEVEVLFANMEKLKGLTKKIQGSLNRLETSGKSVEEAIGPIYGNTRRLQITNSNIDKVIDVIERLRAPLDQSNNEERIIRSDPRSTGISEYISSLDRATRALAGLRSSNLKSNQAAMSELSSLLRFGAKQLEDIFREILREDARPLEPLHYITKQKPFPPIPEDKVSRLRLIQSHIVASMAQTSQSPEYPTNKAYTEIRGDYLAGCLRNLAAACLSTARKTNADAIYKPGTNGIATYSVALEGLAYAEYDSLCPIFSRDDWARVCTATFRNALNEFGKTLRDLNIHIQNNLLTDCFLAFEIIDVVTNLTSRLDKRIGELKQPITDVLKPIRETAKQSLPRMLEDTRGRVQALVGLPNDGSAVPVTTEVMARLQALTTYLRPLSSVMTSMGDGGWSVISPAASTTSLPSTRSFDVGADGNELFAHYASDMLEALITSLDGRSRLLLKTGNVQGIFMANNIAIIDRMIRSSDLQPLLAGLAPKIEQWRKKAVAKTLEAWREPSGHLLDVQYTNRNTRPASGGGPIDSMSVVKSLGSKEKDAIKEKFKNFNTSFDDLVARHRSYRMEKEVRSQLARDIQAIIEPLYGRFWDRYHEIDKGKGKYVRYDKGQLAATLASLG